MAQTTFKLRWRVRDGQVVLLKRHMRELQHFELTPALVGWVHERLEWAAANLLTKGKDAVLVLDIDPEREVRVSLDDPGPVPKLTSDDLLVKGSLISGLRLAEGVWPATVWIVNDDGSLTASTTELFLAADTLVQQLAETQGIAVRVEPQPAAVLYDAVCSFAVSDEFGIVSVAGNATTLVTLEENLRKLF